MNPAEEKELSIDTPQGLQEFLRFIDDVYRDFIVLVQHTNGAEVLVGGDLLTVETARRKAEELVAHHVKVLEFGGDLFEEDIQELQSIYDTIAAAYDRLSHSTQKTTPEHQAYEGPQSLSGVDATLDRAKLLALQADELVYEFGELETAKITTPELKLGKLLFEQLKLTATETLAKVEEIERSRHFVPAEELLFVATKIDAELDALTTTLEQLKKSLLRFFETDDFAQQTPERKNAEVIKKNERAAKLFDQTSLFTEMVKEQLKNPEYRVALQERYASPAAFEAALKREVFKIEAPSRLDSLLGIKHESAFSLLKDMSLDQIDAFDARDRESIRAELNDRNIPYETYMAWIQIAPYLESYVDVYDDMTLLELFVKSEIEMLLLDREAKRNSQGVYNQ